jgi:hypothetical protein
MWQPTPISEPQKQAELSHPMSVYRARNHKAFLAFSTKGLPPINISIQERHLAVLLSMDTGIGIHFVIKVKISVSRGIGWLYNEYEKLKDDLNPPNITCSTPVTQFGNRNCEKEKIE